MGTFEIISAMSFFILVLCWRRIHDESKETTPLAGARKRLLRAEEILASLEENFPPEALDKIAGTEDRSGRDRLKGILLDYGSEGSEVIYHALLYMSGLAETTGVAEKIQLGRCETFIDMVEILHKNPERRGKIVEATLDFTGTIRQEFVQPINKREYA